ncbi:hypothetical protein Q3G72_031695 [Acer saccharum]|nr:hypothetical protein Q3G72_031695 [Acer saccharum]
MAVSITLPIASTGNGILSSGEFQRLGRLEPKLSHKPRKHFGWPCINDRQLLNCKCFWHIYRSRNSKKLKPRNFSYCKIAAEDSSLTVVKLNQMKSRSENTSVRVKNEANHFIGSSLANNLDNILQDPIDVSSSTTSSSSSSSSSEDESHETQDEDDQSNGNTNNQLVLYDPAANGTGQSEPGPEPIQYQRPAFGRYLGPNITPRVLPSVGAFTVQCANCFKWRLIPTKEKYEEIREHILENPFICENAREWRPDISCDDPADISQDGSRLWAIDKPNIAQPPPGWQRLLRIRGEGSTKFADVYLMEHPEYTSDGVTMSQFSFQIPKPLQENYVRKRPARVTDNDKPLEPGEGHVVMDEFDAPGWNIALDFDVVGLNGESLAVVVEFIIVDTDFTIMDLLMEARSLFRSENRGGPCLLQ